MEEDRLERSAVGRLVRIAGYDPRFREDYECRAFLPNPLPSQFELTPETYGTVINATSAIARADEAIALLPNPQLLVRPALRREAVATSALEGTFATLSDVLAADFLDADELEPQVLEVRNYVRAAEEALDWIQERPLTIRFLEHLQEVLVRGTKSDGPEAGKTRTSQVFIGAGDQRVTQARFVPPPPGDLLRDGLESWMQWTNNSDYLPVVIRSAIGHYQFETLHPFTDGNGRLGRLVAILQLVIGKHLRAPVLNISSWLEPRKGAYQDELFQMSADGNFSRWITFFSTALEAQARDVIVRVGALRQVQHDLISRVKESRARGSALDIARDLIGYPVLNVATAAQISNVSFQAANQGVARLVDLGILRRLGDARYDRIFICDEVRRIIEP